MKYFLTILLIIITTSVKAQCDTTETIKLPLYFHLTDTSHYYDYYNSNGVLAWKKVKGYDASLIPSGGWSVQLEFVANVPTIVKGFGVFKMDEKCNMLLLQRLDINSVPIVGKLIHPAILMR